VNEEALAHWGAVGRGKKKSDRRVKASKNLEMQVLVYKVANFNTGI